MSDEEISSRKRFRRQQITDAVTTPMTLREITDLLDIPYYTVARVVRELRQEGRMNEVGLQRGSILYVAKSASRIPEIYNSYNSKTYSITEFVKAHALSGFAYPSSAGAILRVFDMFIEILELSRAVGADEIDEDGAKETIEAFKRDLIHCKRLVKGILSIIDQVLDNDKLWTFKHLKLMAQGDDFPNEIRTYYEALMEARLEKDDES